MVSDPDSIPVFLLHVATSCSNSFHADIVLLLQDQTQRNSKKYIYKVYIWIFVEHGLKMNRNKP